MSDSIESSRPSTSVPFAADVESADPAVLQFSQNAPLPRSPSSKQKTSRKPVPVFAPNHITFPADNAFQPDEKFTVSSQRKSTPPCFAVLPSSQRATLSASQTSYPVVRTAFATSAMDLTSAPVSPKKLSSSLTRISSVPASLFHAPRSSNTPAGSTPVTQSRPSLSSPSPPTPIVPSIPLRHATQHSPAHSLTVMSSPTPHASYSIATSPLDRRFPFTTYPADQSPTVASFATASDPNLSSRSCSTTPDLNQYSLPLKKLLAKPARPSTFQVGGDAESVDPSYHHERTTSTSESVRFTGHEFDIPSIERVAVNSLQPRPGSRDRSGHDYYHYQRTTESINRDRQSKGRKYSLQASGDQPGWWAGWRQSEKESKSKGTGKDKVPNPPRNVLKRRPSNSLKAAEVPTPTHSGSRSLTRSLSASSFLKRAGFLRERPSSVFSPSSPALNSPSPQPSHHITSDNSAPPLEANSSKANELAHSHVEHASAHNNRTTNTNNNVAISNHMPASSVPTDDPLTSTGVSKEASPACLHSAPASKGVQQISGTRLSTISSVSGSSAGSKPREKALSPAGSIAETFKREQLGGESHTSPPSQASQSPSPNLSSTAKGSAEKAADNISGSKRSSNSGLSYADTKAPTDNVIQNQTLDADVKEDAKTPMRVSSDIDRALVVTRSSTHPSATSTPTPTFSPRSSVSSPQLSSELHTRNRLRKSRRTSDQSDGFRPYYTVVGARSEKVFSVGGPRDSLGEDWGVRTTITAGGARSADGIKERASFSRSLSKKISGKFKRERSVGPGDDRLGAKIAGEDNEEGSFGKSLTRKLSGKLKQGRSARESQERLEAKAIFGDNENASFGNRKQSVKRKQNRPSGGNDETMRGRAMRQGGRVTSTVSSPRTPEGIPPDQKLSDDRCLPYFYSLKKHSQSETDIAAREKSNGKFPRFWRLFGRSRSKSRDPNVQGTISDDPPPPLPALPKHHVPDHRDAFVAPPPRKSSYSPKSSPSTPSARPSTATSENAPRFWNRHYSAPSSTSSLEAPPTPSPRINLKRYATMDDTNRTQTQKHEALSATRSPRNLHVEVQQIYTPAIEVERSDSPPIPTFSTADTINSFPPRPSSSDRPKNSPTSALMPSPTSPPARPTRSPQRLKHTDSRRNSFGDEALYPPVMGSSMRPSPKMTYRELAPGKGDAKLTEKEKADRWVALLEKSDAAGGTLHFGGIDDKLPSDDLRFSRTLSELARDDD